MYKKISVVYVYSLTVLCDPFCYRNVAGSGHRFARKGTGITHWGTVTNMLRPDATSSWH